MQTTPGPLKQDGDVLLIPELLRQVRCGNQAETGAEVTSLVGATACGVCRAFFSGAFVVTGFFATALPTAAFLAGAGFVTALTFFAATFCDATFYLQPFSSRLFSPEPS
ncbi:hypothetical protein [Paraburkholderia franconis]|uniref:hypothetical protein n=1 Tax=Paraburkholderia franconis TaxID=2654983 RepID=UPI001D103EA5|nr:hypothetical protein [Paraburkholderia franconis]